MRSLCWCLVPFSAAIFIAVYLLPESFLFPAGIFCAFFLMLSLPFHRKTRRRIFLAALGLLLGFLWTGCYNQLFRVPAHALSQPEIQEYSATVLNFPQPTSRGASLLVQLEEGSKVQLYGDHEFLSLQPGDVITCSVSLAPSDFLHGEGLDYYQSKGVYLLGYAQDSLTLTYHPDTISPRYWPQYTAHALKKSISQLFPSDLSGFLTALITGDKTALPTGLYAAFQRSGISHVIVVSGLHISFLAGIIAYLFGKRTWRSSIPGIVSMFFFAALAGNTPSALRAACMCALLLMAPLVKREPDKLTTLSVTLFLLLLPCPYAVTSISLQLSFAAVAGIYLITEKLTVCWIKTIPKWDKPLGKLCRRFLIFLIRNLAVTIGALLFTTPLSALYFHSISLAGPITNLLTLWAVSFGFLGGLCTTLLGLFSIPLGSILAYFISWPVRWVLLIAQNITRCPFASVSLSSEYLLLWFIVTYSILLLWLASRGKMRPAIPIGALILTLCSSLIANAWSTRTSALTVAALDVGQGASTLFHSQGHTVLVDCGGNSGDDPGDIAADYIQALGSSHLDVLILTHFHTDHACGVPELLSRLDVSTLIIPDVTPEDPLRQEILALAEMYNCKVEMLTNDAHINFGAASMEIYAPLGDGGANEEGLSVLCSYDDYDFLLTGDMNDVIERRLVKYKNLPDIEFLFVGHHGSKNSTSEELLLAVTPEHAVISSGYNRYGHPTEEALERLGAAGCDIYRTDMMGTITFTIKED